MSDLVGVSTFLQRQEYEMTKKLLVGKGTKSMISADDCSRNETWDGFWIWNRRRRFFGEK
jgi:hypothetical protein